MKQASPRPARSATTCCGTRAKKVSLASGASITQLATEDGAMLVAVGALEDTSVVAAGQFTLPGFDEYMLGYGDVPCCWRPRISTTWYRATTGCSSQRWCATVAWSRCGSGRCAPSPAWWRRSRWGLDRASRSPPLIARASKRRSSPMGRLWASPSKCAGRKLCWA